MEENIEKRLRNSGKAFTSVNGKEIAAKKIGPPCGSKCRLRCFEKFDENTRQSIFNNYWSMEDKREQRHFVYEHTESCKVQRKRESANKKRDQTMKYFLYSSNEKTQVCRIFFLNTLDIGKEVIYHIYNKKTKSTGVLKNSCSGGAHNVVNSSVLKSILEHIGSFAVMDSHYCRSQTTRKYLYPGLSINAMYRMYKEKCETDGIEAGTLSKYRDVFNH